MTGIRLFPIIECLQPVPDEMNFIQSLINQIETKNQRLTNCKPLNNIPTPPTIQGFIRSHGYGRTETIIIRKLYQRQVLILIKLDINETRSNHILKGLNSTLRFTIHLGMKSGA